MIFHLNYKILKFGITGLLGMLIDFSTTWICKEKLSINKYVSNSLGFSFAVINNFLLNRFWTFESVQQNISSQFYKFLIVSLAGLAINNLFLYLLVTYNKKNFYLNKFIVIGIVFFWNYFINKIYTFK